MSSSSFLTASSLSPHFPPPSDITDSSTHISTSTPAPSPVPFSAPSTPSYTPCCTPRRLSLSLSLAESSTNLRDSTKTTSTSFGLVRLLLERGISASVYNPQSWDRGLLSSSSGASTPTGRAQAETCTNTPETDAAQQSVKRPDTLLLQPFTPPNSPGSRSDSSTTPRPVFQFSPSTEDSPFYETFLASKPARVILKEVLVEMEKDGGLSDDDDSQTEMSNLGLVDKLKSFRTLSPHSASVSSGNTLLASFSSAGLGSSALGGGLPGLNAGLRRNRSYPAMVGASMAMKDPGGAPCTDVLIPHTMQNTSTHHTANTHDMDTKPPEHTLATKPKHRPQTLQEMERATSRTVVQRHTTATRNTDRHSDENVLRRNTKPNVLQ